MRAGHRGRCRRVRPRLDERMTWSVPAALPAQDLAAGNAESREGVTYEIRNDAEILGNDRRSARGQHPQNRLALHRLRVLLEGIEEWLPHRRTPECPVEPD